MFFDDKRWIAFRLGESKLEKMHSICSCGGGYKCEMQFLGGVNWCHLRAHRTKNLVTENLFYYSTQNLIWWWTMMLYKDH